MRRKGLFRCLLLDDVIYLCLDTDGVRTHVITSHLWDGEVAQEVLNIVRQCAALNIIPAHTARGVSRLALEYAAITRRLHTRRAACTSYWCVSNKTVRRLGLQRVMESIGYVRRFRSIHGMPKLYWMKPHL